MRVLLWGLAAAAFLALPAWADSRRQEFSELHHAAAGGARRPPRHRHRRRLGAVGQSHARHPPARQSPSSAAGCQAFTWKPWRTTAWSLLSSSSQRAFDFNRNGRLEPGEASQAAVIIYGQSLGGRAALRLSRRLHQWGVSVPLLIAVDSFGRDSYLVPPNVRRAANYFQREHLYIKGAPELRAQDPSKTRILFNRRLTFKGRDEIGAEEHSWLQRFFLDEHARVEYLPEVWEEIERMIVEAAQEPWPNGR